jgi:hypothetical protein
MRERSEARRRLLGKGEEGEKELYVPMRDDLLAPDARDDSPARPAVGRGIMARRATAADKGPSSA